MEPASPSPSSFLGLTPRYTIQAETASYKHERVVEVEQRDEAVQVNDAGVDGEGVQYLVARVGCVVGGGRRVLWEVFCECDSSFGGVLDRFDLTVLLKRLGPKATARDISRWVQELDSSDPALSDSGVSFVELLDWYDHQPSLQLTPHTLTHYVFPLSLRALIASLSPGQLSRAVESLQNTYVQVAAWSHDRRTNQSTALEKASFLAARSLGKFAGLSESDYEKYTFLFRQFVKENSTGLEECETTQAVTESAVEHLKPVSLDGLKGEMKQCSEQLSAAKKSYNEALLGDGSSEEITGLQEMITELEDKERTLQADILKAKGIQRKDTPQLTLDVDEGLAKLCALAGIPLTHHEVEVMRTVGLYKSKMDAHSFLCFVAVRAGRV